MRGVAIAALAGFTALTAASAQQAAGVPACGIRYVANAGVLVTSGAATVLVDAPIREGIAPYAAPDAAERHRLERAQPPYDRVGAILVTHWHADHFSPEAVAAHLVHNRTAVLISSAEVVARVRTTWPDMPAARARAVTPEPGRSTLVDRQGLRIHVLRIRHNPARVTPAEHVGFMIEGCRSVLHAGDADPSADNFAVLRTLPRVDVALVPFWFLTSGSSRAMTASAIVPVRTLALHVPPNDAAEISRTLASVPAVQTLVTPGQSIDLR